MRTALQHPDCMTQNLSAGINAPDDALGTPSADVVETAGTGEATLAKQSSRARSAPRAAKPKARRKTTPPKASQSQQERSPKKPKKEQAASSPPDDCSVTTSPSAGSACGEHAYPLRRVRIGSPVALLAVVPWLLEFEPDNSMVVIGTEPPRAQVRVTLRYDLPDPPDVRVAGAIARHAASVLAAQGIESAVAVGYGPAELVTPVAEALQKQAPRAGISVTELLRAQNKRYWSYVCAEPGCCPPEGTPFEGTDHAAARAMAGAAGGASRVLSSRAELAATVAPVDGDVAEVMHRATRKAEEQVARLVARAARSGRRASIRRLIATAGLRAVGQAIERYRRGDSVGPETAAWLTVVLRDLRVRDDAWARMLPEYRAAHLRLWTDLTRMARPGYVAAPAALLAFVAWQSGNGALANVALDRAQSDNPHYSMAGLLRRAVDSGAPPSLARLPMTPEEVAASYDELEAGDEDAPGSRHDEPQESPGHGPDAGHGAESGR
jgi:hypothetical protein